ncbi:MAG: radical SAM protein [bacterium]
MKATFFYRETFSTGVAYLSRVLKTAGHKVDLIFDLNPFNNKFFKSVFLPSLFDTKKTDLLNQINEDTDIFCFSVMTSDYQWALNLCRALKKKYPDKPIILGGPHPTLVPDIVINEESVDMICIGEAEESILKLAELIDKKDKELTVPNIWYKKNGKIIKNELKPLSLNLDDIPFPDYDLFYDKMPSFYKRYPVIIASRGCPFNCTYCASVALRRVFCSGSSNVKYVRQRSVENVIAELEFLKEKYKIKALIFNDDVFSINTKWLDSFLVEYQRKINVPFLCITHLKTISERQAYALKAANCRLVMVGIQSGSEKFRKTSLKRYESNADIINFSKICRKSRLNFSFNHIFNFPYETESDIKEAIGLYNKTRPKIIDTYNLTYSPKTEIIDIAIEAGVLNESDKEKINQGVFPVYYTSYCRKTKRVSNFDKFALFFTIMPLIPKKVINFLLRTHLYKHFNKLPLILMPGVKLILNMRTGTSFMQLDPFKKIIWYFFNSKSKFKLR